mmetsp:Transcript_21266/g.43220  ORF Transcript_21266/g.43220 Transcript_21266/m.43220 type:complete len:203 (-) Transcript_21266:63-671(-)
MFGGQEDVLCFIGVALKMEETPRKCFLVKRILDEGPAAQYGKIKLGDYIIAVDGKSIQDLEDYERMSTGDAVKWWTRHFLGKPGTEVSVTFQRKRRAPYTVRFIRANCMKRDDEKRLERHLHAVDGLDELDECHDKAQAQIQQGVQDLMRVGAADQRRGAKEHEEIWAQLDFADREFRQSASKLESEFRGARKSAAHSPTRR